MREEEFAGPTEVGGDDPEGNGKGKKRGRSEQRRTGQGNIFEGKQRRPASMLEPYSNQHGRSLLLAYQDWRCC